MVQAWSFQQQKRCQSAKTSNLEAPGPGKYDPKIQKGKIISFGKQKKGERHKLDIPAPGEYEYQKMAIYKKAKEFSFGLNIPINYLANYDTLGQYSPKKPTQNEPPKFTMRAKPKSKPTENSIVGPGKYDNTTKYKKKGGIIPQYCEKVQYNENPGPGTYEYEHFVDQCKYKYRIGSSKRRPLMEGTETPGPGGYQIKSFVEKDDGKSVSFGIRTESTKITETPGPGTYLPSDVLCKTEHSGIKFTRDCRNFEILSNQILVPGPGDYDQSEISYKIPPRIGSAKRIYSHHNENPGPGQYEYDVQKSQSKFNYQKQVNTKQYEQQTIQQTPGPGHYDPQISKKSEIQYSIGNELKMGQNKKSKFNIGPGQYEVQESQSLCGVKIGTMKRQGLENLDSKLGPGQYNIKPMIMDIPQYNQKQSKNRWLKK